MHGYFLSLKLYTTARLIANPQSYEEYRDRLVSDRLAAKAESRIRAKREQPKVNKALAERLRRAQEREEAIAAKKAEKRRLAGEQAEEDGEQEQVQESEEEDGDEIDDDGEGRAKKGDKAKAREGLLNDPRFKDLWENPDFEVDEASREFALLNPATVDNAANAAKRKTAVEEEEDESDRESSDLQESEDEEDDEHDDDKSASEESDDGGELARVFRGFFTRVTLDADACWRVESDRLC
jgi:ribosome biogenesis protein ENP2